jgi:hypothetical protein
MVASGIPIEYRVGKKGFFSVTGYIADMELMKSILGRLCFTKKWGTQPEDDDFDEDSDGGLIRLLLRPDIPVVLKVKY